jgi:hypothetical protein
MAEKIDFTKININDLGINHKNIHIITAAKVGTAIFSAALYAVRNEIVTHSHQINVLENFLNINNKKLIISGIRNPLDRNISYFFETFYMNDAEPILKFSDNEYKRINTFTCTKDEINNIEVNDLINLFKNKDYIYHNHFTIWYEQFFNITKINSIEFNKEKGVQLYKVKNDTYILFYLLDKYNDNKNDLENFLNMRLYDNRNLTSDKDVSNKYKEFKKNIKLDNNYKDMLLNTSVMKYFYTDEIIEKFKETN